MYVTMVYIWGQTYTNTEHIRLYIHIHHPFILIFVYKVESFVPDKVMSEIIVIKCSTWIVIKSLFLLALNDGESASVFTVDCLCIDFQQRFFFIMFLIKSLYLNLKDVILFSSCFFHFSPRKLLEKHLSNLHFQRNFPKYIL